MPFNAGTPPKHAHETTYGERRTVERVVAVAKDLDIAIMAAGKCKELDSVREAIRNAVAGAVDAIAAGKGSGAED